MGLARSPKGARGRLAARFALCLVGAATSLLATWATLNGAGATPLVADVGFDGWLDRLQNTDVRVRRDAAWMIGRQAHFAAASRGLVASITARLQDRLRRERDEGVQRAIVYALSRYAAPDVDAALRDVASADSGLPVAVRAAALRARVSRADDPQSLVPWLLRASWTGVFGAPGDLAHSAAVRALAELPHEAFATAMARSREASTGAVGALRAIGLRGDPRWGRALLEALTPGQAPRSSPKMLAAIEAVATLHCVEAAEALAVIASHHDDLTVRRAAVRALASLGGGFELSGLRALVADAALREVALEALGTLGDRGALPVVLPLVDAPWSGDRRAAAEALGALGDRTAVPRLAARARTEPDADARRAMWRAVAHLGGDEAVSALSHDDPLARWALSELLLTGGRSEASHVVAEDASGALLEAISGAPVSTRWPVDPDARVARALALGHGRGDEASRVTALDDALAIEADEGVRVAIVLALGSLANDGAATQRARGAACDVLLSLVEREQREMTLAAVVALTRLSSAGVASAGALALRIAASEPSDALLRRASIDALGRLRARGGRLAVERALMVDPDDAVRGAAAFALASIEGRDAVGVLRTAASVAASETLLDQIETARLRALSDDGAAPRWASVLRAGGAPARSVWCVSLPDGGLAFGVATGDGEVWIEGAPDLEGVSLARVR
jgi:HEAT repeat protein